jgi:hypothetical protein
VNGTYGILIVERYTKHTYPIIARPDGDNRQQHLSGVDLLLQKEAVDHFVQCTVTPNDNNTSIATTYRFDSEFNSVCLVLAEDGFAMNLMLT